MVGVLHAVWFPPFQGLCGAALRWFISSQHGSMGTAECSTAELPVYAALPLVFITLARWRWQKMLLPVISDIKTIWSCGFGSG